MGTVKLPWRKINDFLLEVGGRRDPREFRETALRALPALVPYDAAVLYLKDETGLSGQLIVNVEQKWSQAYLDYFSKIDDGRYSCENSQDGAVEWSLFPKGEFYADFIRPQRIARSATLQFRNSNHRFNAGVSLHRTGRARFSESELGALRVVKPHISNLHANLLAPRDTINGRIAARRALSAREYEVAVLLCEGCNSARIGDRLFVSPRTVDKHIESIHRKLGVSSRQELLVRLFSER
jgi:DNA-binding CsgD family transcriptional regulator